MVGAFRELTTCTTSANSSQIALKKEQELNCTNGNSFGLWYGWLRCQGWWRIKNKYGKKVRLDLELKRQQHTAEQYSSVRAEVLFCVNSHYLRQILKHGR
jgi:hypothetical protein